MGSPPCPCSIFHPVHHSLVLRNRHPAFLWLQLPGADALAPILSWRAACPSHAQRDQVLGSCGCQLLRCVASSSGKRAFIASPTAKHLGHEKYINVTTSFITIFISHLMLSLCDYHTKYIFKGKHIHFYLEKREDTM